MPDFDVSETAGTVFGIAGMGIGLGLLAHTANNITRMTDSMYDRPYERRRTQRSRRSTRTARRTYNRSRRRRPAMYDNYWW